MRKSILLCCNTLMYLPFWTIGLCSNLSDMSASYVAISGL